MSLAYVNNTGYLGVAYANNTGYLGVSGVC